MKAFELMGEVDEHHQLHVQIPQECATGTVRVLVLAPENENGVTPQNGLEAPSQVVLEKGFMQWIEEHAMDAGIEDLAHQHDHYLHGTLKRKDAS